jgi:hypothetical protein
MTSSAACLAVVADAGKQTVNTMFGTRVAVLAGDFLFAQASWLIANLENLEVRSILRQRLMHMLIQMMLGYLNSVPRRFMICLWG